MENEKLHLAIEKLNPLEKEIVNSIFFKYETQVGLARRLKVSPGTIGRHYKQALNNIRDIMEDDNMQKGKITRDQLKELVEIHGTNKEAIRVTAELVGLTRTTIKCYLDEWDVRKYSKDYTGNKAKDIAEEIKTKENLTQSNLDIPPILEQVKKYRGVVGEYEIEDNCVNLKTKQGSLAIRKVDFENLLVEMQELLKCIL